MTKSVFCGRPCRRYLPSPELLTLTRSDLRPSPKGRLESTLRRAAMGERVPQADQGQRWSFRHRVRSRISLTKLSFTKIPKFPGIFRTLICPKVTRGETCILAVLTWQVGEVSAQKIREERRA